MSRWNDTVTLLAPAGAYQDAAGAWHEGERPPREVMCNRRTLSLSAAATLVDLGLRGVVQIQVRDIDYNGEDQALYHGEEFEITYAQGGGENQYLTLSRKVGND